MAPKWNNQSQGAQPLPVVEAKFQEITNTFYEKVLDLNTSQSDTAKCMGDLMNLRSKLLGLYGVAPDPKWAPGSFVQAGAVFAPPVAAVAGAPSSTIWKAKLNEAITKALKRPVIKDEVVYNTLDVDGMFVSTCSCPSWQAQYSGEPVHGKNGAEQAAAQAALKAEYPAFYKTVVSSAMPAAAPAAGQKRKASASEDSNHKGKLQHIVTMLLQRSTSKEDLVYETQEVEKGNCTSTLRLPTYNPSLTFSGQGAQKKDAEAAAATAALAALEAAAAPFIEEHAAKKARRNKENLEKLKKGMEDKKALAKAAAGSA